MARQLFGTDGIRGVAGEYPLDPATVFAFGRALGVWVRDRGGPLRVLFGMDTRESGPGLAAIAAAGLRREGVDSVLAGVLPTPGVAWLTRHGDYSAGVMVSASHNPFEDNGLKVFSSTGYKLPDAEELAMESALLAMREEGIPALPALASSAGASDAYLDFLAAHADTNWAGKRAVVDGGNGAASELAPRLLRRMGVEVISLSCAPDGRNINAGCGALHPAAMRDAVGEHRADFGVAFDGDADRAIFAAPSGRLVDGDHVLAICAAHAKRRGELPGETVVATVMSNIGLERALAAEGIRLIRTGVGDKYVLEEMLRTGAPIGGEQSGHVIFSSSATTGDGLLTMLQLMAAIRGEGSTLEELASRMTVFPQILVNVRFGRKRPLEEVEPVQAAIRDCQSEFGDAGRVLVRFSGTEPLARVMVEGPEDSRVRHHAERIAALIGAELRA